MHGVLLGQAHLGAKRGGVHAWSSLSREFSTAIVGIKPHCEKGFEITNIADKQRVPTQNRWVHDLISFRRLCIFLSINKGSLPRRVKASRDAIFESPKRQAMTSVTSSGATHHDFYRATAALSTCVLKKPPFVRSITCW